ATMALSARIATTPRIAPGRTRAWPRLSTDGPNTGCRAQATSPPDTAQGAAAPIRAQARRRATRSMTLAQNTGSRAGAPCADSRAASFCSGVDSAIRTSERLKQFGAPAPNMGLHRAEGQPQRPRRVGMGPAVCQAQDDACPFVRRQGGHGRLHGHAVLGLHPGWAL